MCLAICDMFHVILVVFIANLTIRMIFIGHRFWLRYFPCPIVMIRVNKFLLVFSSLSCTSFLYSFKVFYCKLLFGPWNTRAVTIRHVSLKMVIVIRLLELLFCKVHWVEKFTLHQAANWGRFEILCFYLSLCESDLDSTFCRAYTWTSHTCLSWYLLTTLINRKFIELVENLSCAYIIVR